jgi:hypothetical protein
MPTKTGILSMTRFRWILVLQKLPGRFGQPKMSAVMPAYQASASRRVRWRSSGASPILLTSASTV